MRNALCTAELSLFLAESQKFYLENENIELKAYIASNRPKYLPDYVEDFATDPEHPELDEIAISEANSVLVKPFKFYGGYLMEMLYKKNEVLTQGTVQHLMKVISQLQREKELMNIDREAINNVATLNFDLAQNDADRIKEQADTIKELNKMITLNKRLVTAEKS